jgi:polyhydroxyalkanoate synthesis regulator phasin
MVEMAERAQVISQEAGTKIAAAMKDVISTAAGVAGFAVESARDLLQYMVRRGQMTQDEADKLIREAEDARGRKSSRASAKASAERTTPKVEHPACEAVRRDPAKGAANASVKRSSAAAPAQAEKANKTEKKAAKRAAAQKKTASKPATSKKRR